MNQFKLALTVASFLFFANGAFAQSIPGEAIPASGKGVQQKEGSDLVNVNLYTGQGSVTIPLYNYAVDKLDLGISLSYNSRGIRVDEMASSVGLGWDINIGGSIVREVRGIEDEVTTPARFKPPNVMYYQWGDHRDTLQGILSPDALDPFNLPVDSMKFPVYDDEEYDIFHASLGGRGIKFSFKRTTSGIVCVQYPESKIKIELITKEIQNGDYVNTYYNTFRKGMGMDSIHNILTFIITDEYENKFYFERGDYQIKQLELPVTSFHNPNAIYYPTDNWILTKVITYTNQQIDFYYTKKFMTYAESQREILHGYLFTTPPAQKQGLDIKVNKFNGYKHHISRIDYPNGVSAIFDLHSDTLTGRCDCKQNFRVKSLTIKSEVNSADKHSYTYKFDHAYFNSPKYGVNGSEISIDTSCAEIENDLDLSALTTFSSAKLDSTRKAHSELGLRLKLKSIQKIGTDETTSEPIYTFSYNSISLPYRFNGAKDYYGYYNGTTVLPYYYYWDQNVIDTYYLSIPQNAYTFGTNNFHGGYTWGAQRHYDFTNAQAAILTKIKNQYGGQDSIVYTNYYLTNPSCSYGDVSLYYMGCNIDGYLVGDTVNDGLVIGKIISKNGYSTQSTLTTEYTYLSGQRFFRGGYPWYVEPETGHRSYTNFFADRHDYYNGSNHGFDTVVVSKFGYNNIRLSKTKYAFSNLMYSEGGNTYSCIEKPTGYYFHLTAANIKKYRMGLPLCKEEYDEWDTLTAKDVYTYEDRVVADSILNINRIKDTTNYFGGGWNRPVVDCWVCGTAYWETRLFDYHAMFPASVTSSSYVYDPVTHVKDSMVNSKTYAYNSDHELKSVFWKDSKGDSYVKHHLYNSDYGNVNSVLTYLNQNNLKHLISTETWVYTTQTPPYTDSMLLDFEIKAPANYLRFPCLYQLVLKDHPLNSSSANSSQYVNRTAALNYNSNAGTNLLNTVHVTRYDSKGNVTEIKRNNIEVYDAAIWDVIFNYKIADVQNARWEDIAYTSFESIYPPFGAPSQNKGNLDFNPDNIIMCPTTTCPKAVTGKYAYELSASHSNTFSIITSPLNAKEYILSFWCTDDAGSILDVSLNNGTTILSTIQTSVVNTVGNWKLRTAKFTAAQDDFVRIKNIPGVTTSVSTYIDEVRLFPVGATMNTYSYKPLFGLGSECDESNNIIHYEYDVFGRLTVIKDMRGNVIRKTETAIDNTDPVTTTPNPTY